MSDKISNVKGSTINSRSHVTTINEKKNEPPDPWYRKPVGIVILGVVVTLLSLVIANVVKFP